MGPFSRGSMWLPYFWFDFKQIFATFQISFFLSEEEEDFFLQISVGVTGK